MAISSSDIIEGVNLRISNPQTQGLLTDANILSFTNQIVKGYLVPLIDSVDGNYFVRELTQSVVANQSNYSVPSRSVGRTLRELKISDTSSNYLRNCPQIPLENAYLYTNWTSVIGFMFMADGIQLIPSPPTNLTIDQVLHFWFYLPPNKLVDASRTATVTNINPAANQVTVDAVPTGMGINTSVDFIQSVSGNSIYAFDKAIQGLAATTFTFLANTIPSTLQIGDFINFAGESSVLNFIPNEAEPYINTLVSQRCLRAISDYEGAQQLDGDFKIEKENLLKILAPRIQGEPEVILSFDSIARSGKLNQRSWLYGN
tara:strand:+ start:3679 stop:4626 length:948 start_codon:yes stop_codon:yes gene_type:complete